MKPVQNRRLGKKSNIKRLLSFKRNNGSHTLCRCVGVLCSPMQFCVVPWVTICSCMWVSFDYCRFIELDYTPMEAGIMVSMRQSRGFVTPKSPERHCRSEHHPSIIHSFCLNLFPVFFYSLWHSSGMTYHLLLIWMDCISRTYSLYIILWYIYISYCTIYINDWTACSGFTICHKVNFSSYSKRLFLSWWFLLNHSIEISLFFIFLAYHCISVFGPCQVNRPVLWHVNDYSVDKHVFLSSCASV